MKKIVSIIFLVLTSASNIHAQSDTVGLNEIIKVHLAGVKLKVEKRILPGRYMCTGNWAKPLGTSDTLPGWEGFKVQLFEYTINDKKDGHLTAKVYLLNADSERIARWAIAACWMIKGNYKERYVDTIIKYINRASNGQFPVKGIVYEDLEKKDGIQETYPFFDGVTVTVKGIEITTPQRATATQQDKLLQMTLNDIAQALRFGRIISTTRENYELLFPNADTTGIKWCDIVREEYKRSLNSNVNYLINAWVKGNPKLFK